MHFLSIFFWAITIWTICTFLRPAFSQNATDDGTKKTFIAFSLSETNLKKLQHLKAPMMRYGIERIGNAFIENRIKKGVGLWHFGKYLEKTFGYSFIIVEGYILYLKPTWLSNKSEWQKLFPIAMKENFALMGSTFVYFGCDKKDEVISNFTETARQFGWDFAIRK